MCGVLIGGVVDLSGLNLGNHTHIHPGRGLASRGADCNVRPGFSALDLRAYAVEIKDRLPNTGCRILVTQVHFIFRSLQHKPSACVVGTRKPLKRKLFYLSA